MDFKTVIDNEYDDFMKQYRIDHECCPKCGSIMHSTTLAGYPLFMDNKSAYKDLNDCECLKCGDSHRYHDRVKKQ